MSTVHLILQGKGGVGKSVIATLLAQYLRDKGLTVTCFDADPVNSSQAAGHSMSASRYLRALGLALPIQSTVDQRAVLELVKINADLGRLGGLIKMWLTSNESFQSASGQAMQRKLDNTLNEIASLQKKMKDRIEAL